MAGACPNNDVDDGVPKRDVDGAAGEPKAVVAGAGDPNAPKAEGAGAGDPNMLPPGEGDGVGVPKRPPPAGGAAAAAGGMSRTWSWPQVTIVQRG